MAERWGQPMEFVGRHMDKLQFVLTHITDVVPPWVLQALLTVVAAGIGSFGGAYLKRADFANLQSQLWANTELTEKIKAELGQLDWTQQEWTNLRRIKLEALLNKLYECEEYLDEHRNDRIDGKVGNVRELGSQLDTIQTIYFPELVNEVRSYLDIYNTAIRDGSSLVQARSDDLARLEFFAKRKVAVDELKSSARKLLIEIIGVRQPSGRLRFEPSVAPPSSRQGDVANGDVNANRHSTGSKALRRRLKHADSEIFRVSIIGLVLIITTIFFLVVEFMH